MPQIGREVDFGMDNFGNQKILSQPDTMAQVIINLLLLKPGQMPSMPHLGINIKKYLYQFSDDLNTDGLRREIEYQCSEMIPYLDTNNMAVFIFKEMNNPVLMIVLPFYVSSDGKDLVIAFKNNVNLGRVTFNYDIQDTIQ